MPWTVLRDPRFDDEFLALPVRVRDSCWHIIGALRRKPNSPGPGFRVERLRKLAPIEAWAAHFEGEQFRLLYVVDGNNLILFGVGRRPGFYRRLDRLRDKSVSARGGLGKDR
jgi:hypothetical protein